MQKQLYILELQDNKFYIGLTDNLENTYEKHLDGMYDYWTYRFRPISIKCTMENIDVHIFDQYIEEYMQIYGEDNIFYEQIPSSHYYHDNDHDNDNDNDNDDFVEEYYDDLYEDRFVPRRKDKIQDNNNFAIQLYH